MVVQNVSVKKQYKTIDTFSLFYMNMLSCCLPLILLCVSKNSFCRFMYYQKENHLELIYEKIAEGVQVRSKC